MSLPRVAKECACEIFFEFENWKLESTEALVRLRIMGDTGKKVEKWEKAVEAAQWQEQVL